jgi:hypothetical protein
MALCAEKKAEVGGGGGGGVGGRRGRGPGGGDEIERTGEDNSILSTKTIVMSTIQN